MRTTNLLERGEAELLRQRGDAAVLAVPLTVDGRNQAVLELVESRAPRAFTGANVTFAEFMARHAARLLADGDDAAHEQPEIGPAPRRPCRAGHDSLRDPRTCWSPSPTACATS